jgi:anaerobic ribonucleoside-triphosphate reductase activating protein
VSGNRKTIRLSGISYESLVNGPGIRRVFFSQGCRHNCRGCFNPDTHCFEGGEEYEVDKLLKDIKMNPMLKGITFSGGDPLEQAEKFAYLANKARKEGLNIWSYTGYTFEFIVDNSRHRRDWGEFLKSIDVLVDGKFEQELQKEGLKFRGSLNQRIIDVKQSLASGEIVTLSYE